jgi:hypothetical protein
MHYNSGFGFKVTKGFQIFLQIVLEIECDFLMLTSVNVSVNTSVKGFVNGRRVNMHYNSGFGFKVSKGFQIFFQVVLEIECVFLMHTSVNVSVHTSVKGSVNGPRCKYALQFRIWF